MNAKRGYVPDDDRFFSPAALETLRTAARHVCYLINEGYDLKMASTFVGNHFLLSERQRLAITRSVATEAQLKERRAKEKASISGCELWIDGFNTIITLEVMLSGSPLFCGMDGCIRDLASLRGSYRIIPETDQSIRMLLDALETQAAASIHILLDQPVSNSGRLMERIAELGEGRPFPLDIQILRDVDRALWEKGNVISSDSIILDHCVSWVNLLAPITEAQEVQLFRLWEGGFDGKHNSGEIR